MRCGVLYNQNSKVRWLWQAVDCATAEVLAYVLDTREDRAFLQLKAMLAPFNLRHFYTDGWGTYERHLDQDSREVVGCYIGDRSDRSAQALWNSLPAVYRQCAVCYTDFWSSYLVALPSQQHRAVGKETEKTS